MNRIKLNAKAKVSWDYGDYSSHEGFDVYLETAPGSPWGNGDLNLRVEKTPGSWLVRDLIDMDRESISLQGDHVVCVNFGTIMSEVKTLLCNPSELTRKLSV